LLGPGGAVGDRVAYARVVVVPVGLVDNGVWRGAIARRRQRTVRATGRERARPDVLRRTVSVVGGRWVWPVHSPMGGGVRGPSGGAWAAQGRLRVVGRAGSGGGGAAVWGGRWRGRGPRWRGWRDLGTGVGRSVGVRRCHRGGWGGGGGGAGLGIVGSAGRCGASIGVSSVYGLGVLWWGPCLFGQCGCAEPALVKWGGRRFGESLVGQHPTNVMIGEE